MSGSVKNVKILRDIGLDEWFLYSEKYQPFFNWFSQNITEAAVYKESEQREYGDLVDDQLVLDSGKLANELIASDAALADINVSDAELSLLEADIRMLTNVDKELDKLMADTKKTHTKITQSTSANGFARKRIRAEEDALAAECLERAREVQDAQMENAQHIRELNQFYASDQLTPVFIHQMGMHQYYEQCDVFGKHLDQYVRANFRFDSDDAVAVAATDTDTSIKELEIINYKIFKASMEYHRKRLQLAGNKHQELFLRANDWTLPSGATGGRVAMEQLSAKQKELNQYCEIAKGTALNSLQYMLRKLARLEVESAAYENTLSKLQRAEARLDQLRDVQTIMNSDLMNAEIVWLLMHFDIEKLRHRKLSGVLEAYTNETRAVCQRIEVVRSVGRPGTAPPLSVWFAEALLGAMADRLPQLVVASDEETVFGLYERLMLNVARSTVALGEPQLHRTVAERLDEMSTQAAALRKFIQDCPKMQPVLFDVPMRNQLFTIGLSVKQIESWIVEFKDKYIKQYSGPMNKNVFVQAKHLLWVWFLTEPKIVLKALKSITTAAKETPTRAPVRTTKVISGIMRKDY